MLRDGTLYHSPNRPSPLDEGHTPMAGRQCARPDDLLARFPAPPSRDLSARLSPPLARGGSLQAHQAPPAPGNGQRPDLPGLPAGLRGQDHRRQPARAAGGRWRSPRPAAQTRHHVPTAPTSWTPSSRSSLDVCSCCTTVCARSVMHWPPSPRPDAASSLDASIQG